MARKKSPLIKSRTLRSELQRLPVTILPTPPGMEKFSAVLLRFAEPILEDITDDYEDFYSRISLAVAAWNLALLPDDERVSLLNDILRSTPLRERRNLKRNLEMLIMRKQTQFVEYTWPIAAFHIREEPKEWRVEVAVDLYNQL